MTATGSYRLGIDLGTTYVAAAVARADRVEVVGLGNRAAAVPSVIHLAADGTVLTGEAADRRGPSEPDRVAREFKRRIGDPTPLLLGRAPHSAESLTGMLLRWVIDKVAELEGGPPRHIALTHPANWGPYKQDLFAQSVRLADASAAMTLTEPEAAAVAYAANERVERGSVIAVYDLGGGTFDAAVLRKTADGFEILGQPEGIERLGGIDFDEAVIGHVRGALGAALDKLDPDDPATLAALTRLRRECIDAKEALSSDTETSIPVMLPGLQTDVRLTRAEFEQMVRPTLVATVDAMRRALASAEVQPAAVTSVLMVGGSSRIPLVAELVSDAFDRPIAIDAHPKHAIALGAAIALDQGEHGATSAPGPADVAGVAGVAAAADRMRDADDTRVASSNEPARPVRDTSHASAAQDSDSFWSEVAPTDDAGRPAWALPVERGAARRRMRRSVLAGAGAVTLIVVLVAGARAMGGSDTPAGAEVLPAARPTPTVEAAEVPQPPAGGARTRASSDGGGGGAGSSARGVDQPATVPDVADRHDNEMESQVEPEPSAAATEPDGGPTDAPGDDVSADDATTQDTGDATTQDTGDATTQDTGDATTQDTGDATTQDTGDATTQDTGDGQGAAET